MENRTYSARFLQQRKFYTFLPLLVLPFLTFFYWAAVVKNVKKHETTVAEPTGLNTNLPDPALKEGKPMDKLSYYQKAAEDSAKRAEQIKKDPYRKDELVSESENPLMTLQSLEGPNGKHKRVTPVSYKGKRYSDPNEAKVYGKLKELDAVLAASAEPGFEAENKSVKNQIPSTVTGETDTGPDMQRLESLMAGLEGEAEVDPQDPEMKELNELLEKVMDIQHPERVTDRLQKQSQENENQIFPVTTQPVENPVTTLENTIAADSLTDNLISELPFQQNGFFSLDQDVTANAGNAIPAVVHQDQQLVTGATVKLRLTGDVYVGGVLIPKDSFVFGQASLNGERLMVQIVSIRYENSLLPVKLSVYDLDGIAGIHIPDAISRDVAKQSLGQDIQGVAIGSLDPSLGAQAASAGIQAAKTLIGKKARLVQVSLKAGYQVLLRDGNGASM
ncbi:conjugative transposon protein TraM [Dyadobacter frigoris]|uniref:Conjugative transposon protein TraM n=1 Tax=Dyadobacter frigoris TaxID=2576211 RepID=A0A4U6CSV3_9BACT|nr:conjugative transposon protein TraM [Dyadobacter frigoris]TKT86018.1 conjugative transposon protein TraM [Dyadobacter frigoris]